MIEEDGVWRFEEWLDPVEPAVGKGGNGCLGSTEGGYRSGSVDTVESSTENKEDDEANGGVNDDGNEGGTKLGERRTLGTVLRAQSSSSFGIISIGTDTRVIVIALRYS